MITIKTIDNAIAVYWYAADSNSRICFSSFLTMDIALVTQLVVS